MIPIPSRRANLVEIKQYLLYDDLSAPVAAGAVNGSLTTHPSNVQAPVAARVVTDTENKVSVVNGVLTIAGGKATPGDGDPAIWWSGQTRVAGRLLQATLNLTQANQPLYFGWDNNQAGAISHAAIYFRSGGSIQVFGNGTGPANTLYVATTYQPTVILRTAGIFAFLRGGAFGTHTLIGWSDAGTTSALYPGISNNNATFTAGQVMVPLATWLPIPLASDSFNRADGAIGSTDGAGHAEANGGDGLAYTAKAGTWVTATQAAVCSVLASGLGIATLNASKPDVWMNAGLTIAGGQAGVVMRYVDADNYLYAYHDGTNAALIKRAAGVESNVIAPTAKTYVAGAELRAVCYGTYWELLYNGSQVGTRGTVLDPTLQTSTLHGLYSTNTGNSFTKLQCWARDGY